MSYALLHLASSFIQNLNKLKYCCSAYRNFPGDQKYHVQFGRQKITLKFRKKILKTCEIRKSVNKTICKNFKYWHQFLIKYFSLGGKHQISILIFVFPFYRFLFTSFKGLNLSNFSHFCPLYQPEIERLLSIFSSLNINESFVILE